MKILCVFGEHNYGDPSRGQGYEYANFIPALRRLGHEVAFFESLNKTRYSGFPDLNRSFLSAIERERPDVVLCVLMAYELWTETLEMAKEIGRAFFINWSTDDSWKYRQFSRLIAPWFDLYATTSSVAFARAQQDGLDNFYLTQWAAAGARLQEPLAAGQCRYLVSFIGSRYGNRSEWVNRLRGRGIDVACFGHGWEHGAVASEDIPKIMRESVISLNFGDSDVVMDGFLPSKSRQIKARVFEVPGCGGFLLTQVADDLGRYYELGSEVATFDGLEDLIRKINHYRTHPAERDRIAWASHVRTKADHTYEARFSQLLQLAAEKCPSAALPQSFAVQRTRKYASRLGIYSASLHDSANSEAKHPDSFEQPGSATLSTSGQESPAVVSTSKGRPPGSLDDFHTVALRHRQTVSLRLFRKVLTVPCVWIWGQQRGPRAARRILFELSWRLCGETTYSAAGWPGRIFYKES
jgi:spore maturation protein CgeB